MRYKQLFEKNYYAPPAEQVANDILKNCQPFLKANGMSLKDMLYRGTKESNEDFFVGIVEKDRSPRDSESKFHNDMVTVMNANGIKAHRGNSIFCSGDYWRASYYGKVYVIFPIGNFSYSWAPEIHDLKAIEWYDGQEIRKMDVDELSDFVINEYKNNIGLKNAVSSGNEIMVACDKYYAIDKLFYDKEVGPLL